MEEEEEMWCECSDDEKYNPGRGKRGIWEPTAEDILKLYEELTTKKVLELSWKCPGRRPPESEQPVEKEAPKEVIPAKKDAEEEKKQVEPTEFDFDDDTPATSAVITPRRLPGSTPKPQKKVASMQKVLQDLVQKKKVEAAEREARKLAKQSRNLGSPGRARLGSPAGSPRTPSVNRQSPVRLPGDAETAQMTTPVRAPPSSVDASMRTPTITASTPVDTPNKPPLQTDTPVNAPPLSEGSSLPDITKKTGSVSVAIETPETSKSETESSDKSSMVTYMETGT